MEAGNVRECIWLVLEYRFTVLNGDVLLDNSAHRKRMIQGYPRFTELKPDRLWYQCLQREEFIQRGHASNTGSAQ